jgi:Kef-type K+ transport system membrane component KefB
MQDQTTLFLNPDVPLNLLLLTGVAVFVGTIGAWIFKRIKLPPVVGFIIAGLIVGEGWLKLLPEHMLNDLRPVNYFALGLIGFMMGGELKADNFRKYRKQFMAMVLAEGAGAFIFVGMLIAVVAWYFTGNLALALVLGLLIGAISSASDPVSTVQVFEENRTRGALTTAITSIVALDDALALILCAIATSLAGFLAAGQGLDLSSAFGPLAYRVLGSLCIGFITGLFLAFIYKIFKFPEKLMPYSLVLIVLLTGIALAFKFDVILASMAFGVALVNLVQLKSSETFDIVKRFAPPIYVLFFVYVGARLRVDRITLMIGALVVVYVVARSIGKVVGVFAAAKISGASRKVQQYSGMCLFTQAGIAVGLSIMATQYFNQEIENIVLTVITITTLILQVLGPIFIKLAVTKANEVNLNVTEADLIEMYTVKDVMDATARPLSQLTPLSEIMALFSDREEAVYCISDHDGDLLGYVTLDGVRTALNNSFLSSILIADDVMSPVRQTVTPKDGLAEALRTMSGTGMDFLPVVDENDSSAMIGILIKKDAERMIATELLKRKDLAEHD